VHTIILDNVLLTTALLFSACGPTWTVTPAVKTNTQPTPTAGVIPSLVNSATPPTAYVPRVEAADCAFEVSDGYHPKRGYLVVPETRANPTGRKFRLRVAVFKSTDANPALDPVIFLASSPGGLVLAAALPILRKGDGDRKDLH
jgi:hypothetical protein